MIMTNLCQIVTLSLSKGMISEAQRQQTITQSPIPYANTC